MRFQSLRSGRLNMIEKLAHNIQAQDEGVRFQLAGLSDLGALDA